MGTSASFSVTATNAVTYQWQQWNGSVWVAAPGGTNASTYTIATTTLAMNTNTFRVLVNGLCTVVPSNAATLFVNALPVVSLTASPLAPVLLPTQTTNLVATVNPAGGTFVWFKNNVVIPGAVTGTLANRGVNDAGTYRFVYTDPNTCVNTSNDVVISAQVSDNLYVYPNPNTGTFQVRFFNQSNEQVTVNVFGPTGQLVYRRAFPTTLAYSQMDVVLPSMHAAGVYIVKIINASGVVIATKSIIVGN